MPALGLLLAGLAAIRRAMAPVRRGRAAIRAGMGRRQSVNNYPFNIKYLV
jgi:hypothetical protein